MRGLSLSADIWEIDRTDLLGQRSTAQIDESDAALLRAYTRGQIAAGVPVNQIDIGTGASYKGDPDVERFALTPEDRAAFAAHNAANPGNPAAPAGRIFARYQPFVNLASSQHAGVDFQIRYVNPRQAWGRVSITSDWSYLDKSTSVLAPPNVTPIVNNGLYGDGAAKWRGTTNIAWDNGPWNVGLGVYYVGETQDTGATTTQAVYDSLGRPDYIKPFFTAGRTLYRLVIDPVVTANLTVSYRFEADDARWLADTRIRLGVVNLTNEAPPLASGAFGYDPGVNQALLSGRVWSLEVTRRF